MPETDEAENIIASSTLLGDLRDAILDRLRAMRMPWATMSQAEQNEMIENVTRVATHLVHETTNAIASKGFPTVKGKLIHAKIKDAMQLQVDISRHDAQRLTVLDSVGLPVLLVIAEPDMFMGEKKPPKTSLDEKLGL